MTTLDRLVEPDPPWFTYVHDRFAEQGAEVIVDTHMPVYVSIHLGYAEALEIEQQGPSWWVVTYRKWDRTHGLAEELQLVEVHRQDLINVVIDALLKLHTELQHTLEAEFLETEEH